MPDSLSEEAIRQLHFRYKLIADAAKSYFEDGFSVVIQDNYYGDELNRIGIKKMRRLAEDNLGRFAIYSGNRYLIIRTKFEKFMEETSTI